MLQHNQNETAGGGVQSGWGGRNSDGEFDSSDSFEDVREQ